MNSKKRAKILFWAGLLTIMSLTIIIFYCVSKGEWKFYDVVESSGQIAVFLGVVASIMLAVIIGHYLGIFEIKDEKVRKFLRTAVMGIVVIVLLIGLAKKVDNWRKDDKKAVEARAQVKPTATITVFEEKEIYKAPADEWSESYKWPSDIRQVKLQPEENRIILIAFFDHSGNVWGGFSRRRPMVIDGKSEFDIGNADNISYFQIKSEGRVGHLRALKKGEV